MGILKAGRDVGAGALNLIKAARRAELTPGVSDKALPLVLPRARLSPDFIDRQADRVARQMIGEHVTSGKPKDTKNLAGRSMKESARVKKLDYKLSPVGTVAEEVQYTPRKGDVTVAFPGDQTVSNKLLEEVNGLPIDSVQEGGAYYGLGQKHLPEPEFWKSTVGPAKNVQGKVDRVSELFEPERIIGSHLAMGPVSNNFAMHFADANLRAIDWQNVNPKKLNVFDNIIAGGYKDPVTGERVRFPNWPGIADPEAALAAMKDDTALRKWFNNRMKTPKLTKPLGLPNGLDIQYAITEPRLRDMEINMTGLMTGELKPGALVEAAGNPHNTYSHRILGEAKGPQEVLTPFVVGFPDAAQHIATTQRPSDFTGTIQKVFPHQLVDDQYIDDVNRYRERIKKLTGQKDGGAVEASEEGGSADDFDARVGKLIDQHHFDNRLNEMIDQHMAGGGLAKGIKAGVKMLFADAPQAEALKLAQERAALPPSKGGLGLPKNNTAEQRAAAMGTKTDVYHGTKQDITGAFKPGYDDNLAFVTKSSEFANNWIGKGKKQARVGKEAEEEVKAAEEELRKMKYEKMDYESLKDMRGKPFYAEYDKRSDAFKKAFQETIGIYPDKTHSTVYPLKVQANKTFNPETDMDVMAEFFEKNNIPKSSQDLYAGGNYMMYETKPVVEYLKGKGYDSMRLRESTGDDYPTIAVFNPEAVRSRFAAFDPFRRDAATAALMGVAAPDLLAAEPEKKAGGGKIVKSAMNIGKRIMADSSLPALEREANLQKFLEPSKAPMRLYHGTTATEGGKGTEAIRRIKPSKDGALGSGTYLTPSTANASGYSGSPNDEAIAAMLGSKYQADTGLQFLRNRQAGNVLPGQEGGNMLPVHAQIRNPLIIEGTHGDPMVEALTKLGMEEDKALRMVERAYENKGYIGKEVQSRAQAQGYDGLMQYRDGELSEVVSYNPNAVKSAIGNQGTYDISQPDLSKAEGGVAHMGAGGKISKLMADILKSEGRYGAGRLERAADEIPNLEKMYQREALMRAFSGDNAKALMTMNPKDFERYAARLPVENSPLKALKKNEVPTKWNSTTEDYVRTLSGLPKGFNDVPFLMIDKAEQGLPLVPFIAGHEGRHRNRALAGKGVQSGLIQLLPRSELREGFPRRSQQEYIEALKKELEMTGNKVKPEGYVERSEILLPDIYADGGAVHMKEGRTPRDFKPAETPEQEIMRYLRMLRVNAIGGVSQGGASVDGRLGVEIPVSENVSIEPYVQGFAGFGKPQGGGGANLKFRFADGGAASGTNADILDVIAQSKAKTGPSTAALPRYGNMPPESQFERDFRARLAAQQEARQRVISDRSLKGMAQGAAGALAGYGSQIPGLFGDAASLYQEFKPNSFVDLPAGIQALPTTDDIQDLLREYINDSPEFSAGMTGGNAVAIAQGIASLPALAKEIVKGVPKIAGAAVSGAKALGPTAAKLAEEYMMSTGMMLPVVKPKGGNWVTGSAEDSLKGLKRQGTAVMPFNETDLAERIAQGYTVHDPATGTYSKPNPINQFVDKQLTRYVKNEMGTPEDPVRLAADAFPAAKAKMLADKQKQIDKATADMEKARAERGFTPEMMTRSQARIRDLEKEKELIEYRTGLHYEPQRGSARAKEVREALGMPLDPVSTSPYGQAWENKSDTAISGLPYRLRLPMVSPDTAPDALRALGGEFAAQNPNALAYSVSPYVRSTNLGFDHIVDELSNAINPVSGLPKGLIVDPNDLSKWTVPQAVEHVDKINAWRAAQKAEADLDRANNVATVLHKDFPDKGMRWVELKIPEALPEGWSKSASGAYIDPQGGKTIYNPNRQNFLNSMKYEGEQMQHCVAGDRYCRAVELGDSRIFSLRDAKGKPHATIETQKNSLDQYLDKLPDKTYDQWIEEFKNLPEYNNADPLWRPGASPEWTKFLKENKGLNEIPDSIAQIKGPRDRTPKEEYFPYIQDFVKSGKWGNVEELFNAGLHKVGNNYLTQPEMDALIKANGGMKRGGAVRMDALESAVNRSKGGNVKKAVKSVAEYIDPVATKISDWEWRALQDVKKDVPITIVPDYVQAGYGQFMKDQAKKAAAGSLNDRDLMKAYLITQSSIGRGGLSHSTATKTGLKVPNAQEVRPEGAFATWLGSPAGQRYLDAAQKGEIDPKSLEDLRQKFAPFGKQNQLVDQMASAVKTIPSMTPELNLAISGNANDYRDFAERLKGVAAAKSGFIGSLLGRGDLPTFDARQIGLHTSGMPMPTASVGPMLSRGKGLGGREAVDRLAARQKNMGLKIDPSLDPHYQHLTHHAIWDALGGEKTTHQDLIDAMKNYARGGSVNKNAMNMAMLGKDVPQKKRSGGLALTRTSLRQRKPNQLAR